MAKKINSDGVTETPLMKQYYQIKTQHPDAILLFRVGDFYETFGEDAITTSKVVGIVLTKRANGSAAFIELAGFPYHSLETYLPKLVRAGYRVAICEQLEDPKATKTIVKRGVTELITPGVTLNDNVLHSKSNNFLCAISIHSLNHGIALLDISTGEFFVSEGSVEYVKNLIQSYRPNEVLFPKSQFQKLDEVYGSKEFYVFGLEDWIFEKSFGEDLLTKHFQVSSLKGFGIEEMSLAVSAAGAIMHYLNVAKQDQLKHLNVISPIIETDFVWLDNFTIRNLEINFSLNEKAKTLFDIMDQTCTPMGSRLLKRWLVMPLKNINQINQRLDITEYFYKNKDEVNRLIPLLKDVGDLERLSAKLATGRSIPRELVQLKKALKSTRKIKDTLEKAHKDSLKNISNQLNDCDEAIQIIESYIEEEAPINIAKGNVIRKGINKELDELRNIAFSGKEYLISIQNREIENTGISSLKVGFNNVFGYYIEVTNVHKNKVPESWVRKQTLTNAERYITEELKEYETKILGAEEKIASLELKLYNEAIFILQEYIFLFQQNAKQLSQLDCLLSFANVARQNNYKRPEINDGKSLLIIEGRHPVIEKVLPNEENYVPNDLYLDEDSQQIIMITGPNMSGKSAILRQTAIIVLMAQAGSFVPVKEAKIGFFDKIFTRVGANDNLSLGESTFMVEMNETASILNKLSDRSLVLLDEIGRGTSTYDGISIAWSIADFIHNHPKYKAKTLFATHYHELNEMAFSHHRIKNYHVSVKEHANKVIFLRKLIPGGSEHSFGIHVAKMAGMPKEVLQKANEVLKKLEKAHQTNDKNKASINESNMQLSFFQLEDPVLLNIKEELQNIDINTLTPVEALLKLNEIKKHIGVKN